VLLPEPLTPGDAHEAAQGARDIDVAQIVGPGPAHDDLLATTATPAGHSMRFSPRKNWPVMAIGAVQEVVKRSPAATTAPPCSPAPGPMSTTKSALRMVSSSCSTTTTVLPGPEAGREVASTQLPLSPDAVQCWAHQGVVEHPL